MEEEERRRRWRRCGQNDACAVPVGTDAGETACVPEPDGVMVKERSKSPVAAWRYTAENASASDVLAILRMDAFRGGHPKTNFRVEGAIGQPR